MQTLRVFLAIAVLSSLATGAAGKGGGKIFPYPYTIDDLPNEILQLIFNHLVIPQVSCVSFINRTQQPADDSYFLWSVGRWPK